jgi:hypothetical protein
VLENNSITALDFSLATKSNVLTRAWKILGRCFERTSSQHHIHYLLIFSPEGSTFSRRDWFYSQMSVMIEIGFWFSHFFGGFFFFCYISSICYATEQMLVSYFRRFWSHDQTESEKRQPYKKPMVGRSSGLEKLIGIVFFLLCSRLIAHYLLIDAILWKCLSS